MAMYENRGFCPNNSFVWYQENVNPMWDITCKLLGDRVAYMVYDNGNNAYYGGPYIVDAMKGGSSSLGVEIAHALGKMIPKCVYTESGRPIVCADLVNPYQIPASIVLDHEEWKLCSNEDPYKTVLLQDERYLVAIQDEGEEVKVYLFKKQEK